MELILEVSRRVGVPIDAVEDGRETSCDCEQKARLPDLDEVFAYAILGGFPFARSRLGEESGPFHGIFSLHCEVRMALVATDEI